MLDPAPRSSFVVYSTAGKYQVLPPSALAVLGEYIEEGQNHGKPTYKRQRTTAQRALGDVFIFYWDDRDGKEREGWWFGDKVGAGQVWSRCRSTESLPPQTGWQCPIDGPVLQHLVCVPKVRPKRDLQAHDEQAAGAADSLRAQQSHFVLASHLGANAPDKVRALCGRFDRRGFNHGKRTYFQKEASCWLYFWDERDGPDFTGWWLGRRVGGAEVFGVAKGFDTAAPPEKGWQIPHDDSRIRRDVSLRISSGEDVEVDYQEEPEEREVVTDAPEFEDMDEGERLAKVKDTVADSESLVEKAVETVRSLLKTQGDMMEECVRAACELLQSRLKELETTQASIDRHCAAARKQKVSKAGDAEFALLEERLEQSIGTLRQELPQAREHLSRVDEVSREERDVKAFEAAFPAVMEAVSQAELQAELAVSKDARSKACKLIDEVMEEISAHLDKANRFAPNARNLAEKEFGSLQQRCQEMKKELVLADETPVTEDAVEATVEVADTVESAMEQEEAKNSSLVVPPVESKAGSELKDLADRMTFLESELARLDSMLSTPLSSEAVEDAMRPLPGKLSTLLKILQLRSSLAIGGAVVAELQQRGKDVVKELEKLKSKIRMQKLSTAGLTLLEKAREDAQKAKDLRVRIEEAQAPWSGGAEGLEEDESAPALEAAEKAAQEADLQVQSIQTSLQERLIESRRLPEGNLRFKTTKDIEALVADVDAVALQVTQLKVDTFARRTKRQMLDAVRTVGRAEAEVQKVTEAARPLSLDNLATAAAGSFREVASKIQGLQPAAHAACAAAREAVDKHKTDEKERASPSFHTQLAKLDACLSAAQAELSACCQAGQEAEGNRLLLQEKTSELAKIEEETAEVELLTLPLGDELPSEEADLVTFKRDWDVNQALAAWMGQAKALEQNPHVALRLAIGRLLPKGNELKARLQEVKALGGVRREQALCKLLLQAADKEVLEVEEAMLKAEEVEGPFLTGLEDLQQSLCSETLTLCKAEALKTQRRLDKAEIFFKSSLREVQLFTCKAHSGPCLQKLKELSARVQLVSGKLSQYGKDMEQRKRRLTGSSSNEQPPQKAARI
eukprot:TRINITY_DN40933_c0_g1_i1.p1 TRINITY_DN40933_c0_g1~~TRINITY_DN40933_c0_g1_i1.p1  ORF type:complete len:1082 (-),score=318.49 TRINITY_DN40933_c0_g1_i1:46-3291(-)